ncbi:MAG TPA: hypothetical protein VLA12_01910 [Planctomycetaceae bacterium]|nr:hypothetical protein [Planctomycetaceae bacterium]
MPALKLHPGLASTSRLGSLQRPLDDTSTLDWVMLIGVGIVTAIVSTFVNLHLRVPGHAILKTVFPVAAGLALVPRRGAGTVIGASAVLTAIGLRMGGAGGGGTGMGALTSLFLIGPMLDLALRRARLSFTVYIGFVLAGLGTNVLALVARGTLKSLGLDHGGGRTFSMWFPQAVGTYALCGVAAGLISAFVWFCVRPTKSERSRENLS